MLLEIVNCFRDPPYLEVRDSDIVAEGVAAVVFQRGQELGGEA